MKKKVSSISLFQHINFSLNAHPIFRGSFCLTAAACLCRIIGFFYRIFLISAIGAQGIALYQITFSFYSLLTAVSSAGIRPVLLRRTACKDTSAPHDDLCIGLCLSIIISLVLAAVMLLFSGPASVHLLLEPRCEILLQLMVLSLPFDSICVCINAYLLGGKHTLFPACSQIIEQLLRVLFALSFYRFFRFNGIHISPALSAAGMLFSLMLSAGLCLWYLNTKQHIFLHFSFRACRQKKTVLRELVRQAFPITCSRVLSAALSSAEAILIPQLLVLFYANRQAALTAYGQITGMVLPLLLLPCTLTMSLSAVLLPAAAEADASDNSERLRSLSSRSLLFTALLGLLFGAAVFFHADLLCTLLYGTCQPAFYLRLMASACPFLYASSVLSGILHGLGFSGSLLRIQIICSLLRIAGIICFTPAFGPCVFILCFIISHLLSCLMEFLFLRKKLHGKLP